MPILKMSKIDAMKWLRPLIDCDLMAAKDIVQAVCGGSYDVAEQLSVVRAGAFISAEQAIEIVAALRNYFNEGAALPDLTAPLPLPEPSAPEPEGREIREKTILALTAKENGPVMAPQLTEVADYIRAAWIERFGKGRK